jgi:hypothetical protein
MSKFRFLALVIQLGVLGCGGSGLRQTNRDGGGSDSPSRGVETGRGDDAGPTCDALDYPVCVSNCISENALHDSAKCQGSQWVCPSGFVDSTTCPAGACAITNNACCDPVTGDLTMNPCPNQEGIRPTCPNGTLPSDRGWCIPLALGVGDCSGLEGKPCPGDVHQCTSMAPAGAACSCFIVTDAGAGNWSCSYFIGP